MFNLSAFRQKHLRCAGSAPRLPDLLVNPKQNKKFIKMCNYVTLKSLSFKVSICNHKVLRPIKHVIFEYKWVGKCYSVTDKVLFS